MDPRFLIQLASEVLAALPGLIAAGADVASMIQRTIDILNSDKPATAEQLDAARQELNALKARLDTDPPGQSAPSDPSEPPSEPSDPTQV